MAKKRSNIEIGLYPGPATKALESAIQIMEEFEANERKNTGVCTQKGFSDRFDSSSVDSALSGFPRIGWQTSDHQSEQRAIKKRILEQVREQLNVHYSPHNRHVGYPYGHHSGLVRCLYFPSDLSETAQDDDFSVHMDFDVGKGDNIVMID
jgi:hypothetical protein